MMSTVSPQSQITSLPLDSSLGLAINCKIEFEVGDYCCSWIGGRSINLISGCVKQYRGRWRRLVEEINSMEVKNALNKGH